MCYLGCLEERKFFIYKITTFYIYFIILCFLRKKKSLYSWLHGIKFSTYFSFQYWEDKKLWAPLVFYPSPFSFPPFCFLTKHPISYFPFYNPSKIFLPSTFFVPNGLSKRYRIYITCVRLNTQHIIPEHCIDASKN